MGETSIQWTDATWNPTRGCSRVSAGCERCYAERVAHRFSGPGEPYEGLTMNTGKGPRWTGEVRLVPEKLAEPLRWRKPRRVFVDSMSDLFHEAVPFEYIAAVFGVMAACPQHTFQVLTKRPERAREWFEWAASLPSASGKRWRDCAPVAGYLGEYAAGATKGACNVWLHGALPPWPLPNVWLLTSVENQTTADARIPEILQCPAAVIGVSYEPALGPVTHWPGMSQCHSCGGVAWSESGGSRRCDDCGEYYRSLDWIIVGGESGPGARPFDIGWARDVIAQCKAAGVPVFVKQLGSWPCMTPLCGIGPSAYQNRCSLGIHDRKGGDPSEWPEDLRVRQWPEAPHA